MTENRCSEDLPCSHRRIPLARFAASCFCGRPGGRRMARRTAIGASWRTIASGPAALCSATSCIWARSARRRPRPGANPSKFSTRTPGMRGPWRYSPRIAPLRPRRITRSCSFACRRCGYAGRDNGVRAGWPGSCGQSYNSIGSGPIACQRAVNGHDGTRSYRCWCRID